MSILGKLSGRRIYPKTDEENPNSGDALLVCRADGSTSCFLLDVDYKALLEKVAQGADMTTEETGQFLAAQKAMTLLFAGQSESIMQALVEAMNAPDFTRVRTRSCFIART